MLWLYIFFLVRCSAEIDEKWIFCRNLPAKLIHGLIRRDRVSFYNGQGYLGSMEYSCFPGFNLVGDRVVVCQNGQWTSMPQCIAKRRCAKIDQLPLNSMIESENLIRSPTNFREILAGSIVVLRCADNYRFRTTENRTLTIVCQPDGSWTAMDRCELTPSTCDYAKLYLPARSRITRMNFRFSEHNRQLHRPGSSLEYTCEDGYHLHDGKTSLIVQCLSTGSWSTLPVCDFVDRAVRHQRCSYPKQIQNGSITAYNVTIWEDQSYTGQVIYHCDYGYETVSGRDEIISDCMNGTWTKVEDCRAIPTCSKQDLLSIESQAEHSYVYNVSLQYVRDPMAFIYNSYVLRVCLPNFVHDSTSSPLKIRCQRQTKTWTGVPICRPIVTTTTPEIIDSTPIEEPLISTIDENSMSSVEFSASMTSTTEILETTHAVQCNADEIPSIPDAAVDSSQKNSAYPIGTTLNYVCLTLISNSSSSTTCLNDGTWSIDSLNSTQCQIESNSTPLVSTMESTTNFSEDSTRTSVQSATDSTDFDKYLPELNFTTESITSSTMKSAIVGRQVRHLSSFCLSMPQIEHGQILFDQTVSDILTDGTTVVRGSIVARCQQGYRSNQIDEEPIRISCENGEFLPKLICLEQSRCSLPPPSIDSIQSSIIMSQIQVFHTSTNEAIPGSFIFVQCSTNEILNMTCSNDGHWLSTPTSCNTPFKHRCQANVAIANARTKIHGKLNQDGSYSDGSRVIYQCLDNFIHDIRSGPLFIECVNGRWGRRPRCIPEGCQEPLLDRIENGWKSAESFITHNEVKYYQLTRYTCDNGNSLVDSLSSTIDIECRQNKWQYKTLPKCAPK